MKTVAENDAYVIAVDEVKNRIYFTMRGSWIDTKQVLGWLDDLATAIKLCKPGFTELIDWRQSTAILLTDKIAEAQKMAMQAGLRKAARVYAKDTFLKDQMDWLTQKTGFPVQSFFDLKEAEAWLDEK
ncbi:MAG: hypothetical protein LDL33_10060 [Desulfomonile sp.]|nr:hypothetical protein [Desulfomonile sp.]